MASAHGERHERALGVLLRANPRARVFLRPIFRWQRPGKRARASAAASRCGCGCVLRVARHARSPSSPAAAPTRSSRSQGAALRRCSGVRRVRSGEREIQRAPYRVGCAPRSSLCALAGRPARRRPCTPTATLLASARGCVRPRHAKRHPELAPPVLHCSHVRYTSAPAFLLPRALSPPTHPPPAAPRTRLHRFSRHTKRTASRLCRRWLSWRPIHRTSRRCRARA